MSLASERLAHRLAEQAQPVERLRPPLERTGRWLLFAVVVCALPVLLLGLSPVAVRAFRQPLWVMEWSAGVLTGVAAAIAVFHISLPGRSAHWRWLPAPFLALWIWSLGLGCVGDWLAYGDEGLMLNNSGLPCTVAMSVISVPLGLGLLVMVRHAGAVRPGATAMLGALAITAVASSTVSLFHKLETSLMVLVWHLGTAFVVILLSRMAARRLFNWIGLKPLQ